MNSNVGLLAFSGRDRRETSTLAFVTGRTPMMASATGIEVMEFLFY